MQTYEIPKQLIIKDKATMHQKLIEECMNYYTAEKEINRDAATLEQVKYFLHFYKMYLILILLFFKTIKLFLINLIGPCR